GITVASSSPQVPASMIAANVALGVSQTWANNSTNNSTNALTVSGVISGPGTAALTIAGSGLVVLSGANTYSGGTILGAGAVPGNLTLGSTTALGTGALTITSAGATIDSAVANLVLTSINALNINGDF